MLEGYTWENTCIVTDYDRTITTGEPWATTAFSVFSNCSSIPKIITQERKELFSFYRPIEVDETMEKEIWDKHMSDWHHKAIKVFTDHLTQEMMTDVTEHAIQETQLRQNFPNFLKKANQRNIPSVIFSAGISNIIEWVLEHHSVPFSGIYGNKLVFNDSGKCIWLDSEGVFIWKKNWKSIPSETQKITSWKSHEILLWDSLWDVLMSDKDKVSTRIGFLLSEYQEPSIRNQYNTDFDHVVESDDSDNGILEEVVHHLTQNSKNS